jgi:hypothetical protein
MLDVQLAGTLLGLTALGIAGTFAFLWVVSAVVVPLAERDALTRGRADAQTERTLQRNIWDIPETDELMYYNGYQLTGREVIDYPLVRLTYHNLGAAK